MLACWIYCILLLMQPLASYLGGWVMWEVREGHFRGTMVDMWPNTAKSHQHSPPVSQYGAGSLSMQCCRWAIQVLYPSECAWVYFMPLISGSRPPKYVNVSERHFMIAHENFCVKSTTFYSTFLLSLTFFYRSTIYFFTVKFDHSLWRNYVTLMQFMPYLLMLHNEALLFSFMVMFSL